MEGGREKGHLEKEAAFIRKERTMSRDSSRKDGQEANIFSDTLSFNITVVIIICSCIRVQPLRLSEN